MPLKLPRALSSALLAALGLAAASPVHAAGSALWLQGTPMPAVTPDRTVVALAAAAPGADWGVEDQAAVDHLAAELAAVRPLKDEFDGELQIMRRLEAAIAAVDLIRPEDRELLHRARVFQGYAAHRYFQDTLATDPAAAPWRVEVGGRTEIAPWVDAVAIDPDRSPDDADLPDAPEQLAWQEARARVLLLPLASLSLSGLPEGATVRVDGRATAGSPLKLSAGQHHVAVLQDDEVVQRWEIDLAPRQELAANYLASASDLRSLGETLAEGPASVLLSPGATARLAGLDAPVMLLVEGRRGPLRYAVQGNAAVRTDDSAPAAVGGDRSLAFTAHAALGAGWTYDGAYLIENADAGAPSAGSTVNALSPTATLAAGLEWRSLAAGLGVDAGLPVGEWHDLPVGDARQRLRLHPHLALGHRLLQVTAGPMLPWRLGVGARAHLPLPDLAGGPLHLVAAYVEGLPMSLSYEDGSSFTPSRARTAWVGVGGRLRVGD